MIREIGMIGQGRVFRVAVEILNVNNTDEIWLPTIGFNPIVAIMDKVVDLDLNKRLKDRGFAPSEPLSKYEIDIYKCQRIITIQELQQLLEIEND